MNRTTQPKSDSGTPLPTRQAEPNGASGERRSDLQASELPLTPPPAEGSLTATDNTQITGAPAVRGAAASGARPCAPDPTVEPDAYDSVVVRKNARLQAKVKAARDHLATLPKSDRRTRLLHAAVVRRDEVLLDALLEELGR